MSHLLPGVRNAVRALIVRQGQVLVQHKVYEDHGDRFTLPGGAPNLGETLIEGLWRECREELGCTVAVHELVAVADYFKDRDTDPPSRRHQIEFVFRCEVPESYVAGNGPHPDKHQRNVVWLDLSDLDTAPFWPRGLVTVIDPSTRQPRRPHPADDPSSPEANSSAPHRRCALPVYLGLIE